MVFLYRKYSVGQQMSSTPILVCFFAVFESIFGILRMVTLFPIRLEGISSIDTAVFSNCIETFFLLGTFLLFGLKYHESATEIQLMLSIDLKRLQNTTDNESGSLSVLSSNDTLATVQSRQKRRTLKYRIFLIAYLSFIGITQTVLIASLITRDQDSKNLVMNVTTLVLTCL